MNHILKGGKGEIPYGKFPKKNLLEGGYNVGAKYGRSKGFVFILKG